MPYRNWKGCIILQSVLLVGMYLYQTSLFGGIKPGVYEVNIKASPVGTAEDEWVFSEDGNFSSTGLGLDGKWEDTQGSGFKIKIDEQQIKDGIGKKLSLINLTASDFSLTMKKIEITGTSRSNSIKGTIKTDLRIKLKRPVKTSFSTGGSVSFQGKQNQ